MTEALLTRTENAILTVTINRPESKNAFDTATQARMLQVFQDAARDPGVRVLILTGAGNAFSTGADVKKIGGPDPSDPIAQQWSSDPVWSSFEARVDRLRNLMQASLCLHRMGKPTIAMMRGPAAGAGLAFALACDFRFASNTAVMVTAFARIGTSGDYGGSYFMTKLIGPMRTKELYMLSDKVEAAAAARLGILTRLLPDESLERETYAFAERLAAGPAVAYRYIKENVHAALDGTLEQACEVEAGNMIRSRMTQDSDEAVAAFMQKREPRFQGR
jgi:2-(1,2-epoxy-1,2-dihydrophenyl)acetyl-CoA isomerase